MRIVNWQKKKGEIRLGCGPEMVSSEDQKINEDCGLGVCC